MMNKEKPIASFKRSSLASGGCVRVDEQPMETDLCSETSIKSQNGQPVQLFNPRACQNRSPSARRIVAMETDPKESSKQRCQHASTTENVNSNGKHCNSSGASPAESSSEGTANQTDKFYLRFPPCRRTRAQNLSTHRHQNSGVNGSASGVAVVGSVSSRKRSSAISAKSKHCYLSQYKVAKTAYFNGVLLTGRLPTTTNGDKYLPGHASRRGRRERDL